MDVNTIRSRTIDSDDHSSAVFVKELMSLWVNIFLSVEPDRPVNYTMQ